MLDLKWVRDHLEETRTFLKNRNHSCDLDGRMQVEVTPTRVEG